MTRVSPLRRTAAALAIAVTPLIAAVPASAQAGSGDDVITTTTLGLRPADAPSIIPDPQPSGAYEIEAGQPGSAEQYMVMGIMFAGMGAVVLGITLESRKKRKAWREAHPDAVENDPTTLYEDETTGA